MTVGLVDDGVVPTVIGVSTAEATAALEAHGFAVSTAPHCFDTVAGQDPAGGVEADPGTVIELTFDPCVVPDFTGLRLDSAISIVEDEFVTGLLISWPDHCEDVVLGQSIAQGTTVEPGTTVELTLRDDCS